MLNQQFTLKPTREMESGLLLLCLPCAPAPPPEHKRSEHRGRGRLFYRLCHLHHDFADDVRGLIGLIRGIGDMAVYLPGAQHDHDMMHVLRTSK